MATTLTLEEMEALLAEHEAAEFNLDIDRTMATLIDVPVFELPGLNLRIEGYDAVAEMHRRLLAGGDARNFWAEKITHAIAENSLVREAYIYFDTADGERKTGRYNVVMEFEGDKIKGERFFMDATYTEVIREVMGEDFLDVPGVFPLDQKSPPPLARIVDRAAAHAANSNH